jgi:hypothetical protein
MIRSTLLSWRHYRPQQSELSMFPLPSGNPPQATQHLLWRDGEGLDAHADGVVDSVGNGRRDGAHDGLGHALGPKGPGPSWFSTMTDVKRGGRSTSLDRPRSLTN